MGMIAKATAAFLAFALLRQPCSSPRRSTIRAPRDTEIKLGQTMPYSGPLSGFITLGQGRDRLFRR